MSNFGKASKV